MTHRRLPSVSYLAAVRPDYGWRTDFALLASYSADLVALAAGLLALAGVDDDRGSGSKVDFANAVDQLSDKVRLVVQAGRLVAPVKTPKILTILDRYVREANTDEFIASWHPKIALVKQTAVEGDAAQWRLWIGSRNLTRHLSWDSGLVLTGSVDGRGVKIAGIAEMGEALARHAAISDLNPTRVRSELLRIKWNAPADCRVASVRMLVAGSERGLPSAPPGLRRLIVTSPFLDGTVVGQLGHWGDVQTQRVLVLRSPSSQDSPRRSASRWRDSAIFCTWSSDGGVAGRRWDCRTERCGRPGRRT